MSSPPSTMSLWSTPTPGSPPTSNNAAPPAAPTNRCTHASSARSAPPTSYAATPNDYASKDCSPSTRSPAGWASHPTPSRPGATPGCSPDDSPTTKANTCITCHLPTCPDPASAAHPATAPSKQHPHQPQGAQYEATTLSFGFRDLAGSTSTP